MATAVATPESTAVHRPAPSTPASSAPSAAWTMPHDRPEDGRILIVDDEDLNIRVARKYLRGSGYQHISATTDPREALPLIREDRPDLILLDVMMPEISGLDVLSEIRRDPVAAHIPVVILTAHFEDDIKHRALENGANDFLSKPIDPLELLPRIRNLMTLRAHQKWLERTSERLEEEVRRRTAALVTAQHHVIHCLARAAEFRDNDTGRHIVRVGLYSALIARALGLGENYANTIEQAAKLHDVGKIGIPDSILLKTGKLDPEEFETMRSHCNLGLHVIDQQTPESTSAIRNHVHIGAKILDVVESPLLAMASSIAMTHHEKWDGTGYPIGLKGEQIPLEGRIVAVADVFDALSNKRPYKAAFPLGKCVEILQEGRGSHFDPQVVDAFLSHSNEAVAIQMRFSDSNQ